MTRCLLLALLVVAAPASAQTRSELEDRIASLRTRLDGPDLSQQRRLVLRDSLVDDSTALAELTLAPRSGAGSPGGERPAGDDARTGSPLDRTGAGDDPTNGAGGLAETLTSLPVLGLGVALLALAGAGGWWLMQRRGAQHRDSLRFSPSASRPPLTGAQQGQRLEAAGARPLYASTEQVDALERQVQAQQQEIAAIKAWVTDQHARTEAARTAAATPTPIPSAPPAAQSPADAAASTFADWCRRATPMMSKVDFFANALAERVPGARVQAVYRDLNSQAEPVRFDAAGGASPAEFWLVAVGGEALVFPQPLNAHQFRDLTRIFDGTATPATLGSVVPARVRDEGAAFALVAPGRVS